jgi:hypothetical protein
LATGDVDRRLQGKTIGGIVERSPGLLIVVNTGQHRVEAYNWTSGELTIVAGSDTGASGFKDGAGTQVRFSSPFSIARSPDGKSVYVVDQPSRSVIRRVDLDTGVTACWAGYRPDDPAACKFSQRSSIFHGLISTPDAAVLVAVDRNRSQVLAFVAATGAVEVVAGRGGVGFVDGDATAALFNQPAGIDITPDGQMLFVSEALDQKGGDLYPRLRTIALCSRDVCPFGKWRGPCNAALRGRCVNCSVPAFGGYVGSSSPFDRDTCGWVCNAVSLGVVCVSDSRAFLYNFRRCFRHSFVAFRQQ